MNGGGGPNSNQLDPKWNFFLSAEAFCKYTNARPSSTLWSCDTRCRSSSACLRPQPLLGRFPSPRECKEPLAAQPRPPRGPRPQARAEAATLPHRCPYHCDAHLAAGMQVADLSSSSLLRVRSSLSRMLFWARPVAEAGLQPDAKLWCVDEQNLTGSEHVKRSAGGIFYFCYLGKRST